MKADLLFNIPTRCTLGEGILWDDRSGAFCWTDIEGKMLHIFTLKGEKLKSIPTPERLCAFGFTEEDGKLVAAFESGFAFYWPESGKVKWIAKPFEGIAGLRFNDGRVDAKGRFWCGTMAEDGQTRTISESSLYCLGNDLKVSSHLSSIHISNSICWSPDGTRMYFADSPSQRIRDFDFDMEKGAFSSVHTFAKTDDDIYPDGSVTDKAGNLWNAQWGGGQVVCYSPDGHVEAIVDVPAKHTTCVAFGGPKFDLLAVTSATQNLNEEQLANQPDAGNLFIYRVEAKGLPAPRFQGA